MNLIYIDAAISQITELSTHDDEYAHWYEDDLYHDFVKHIADTEGGELADMAKAILKTEDVPFERWYA
jgi:hypothetical protein